ncbi:MAG: hypothetical protein Q9223_000648 [Gallowayella weberi]
MRLRSSLPFRPPKHICQLCRTFATTSKVWKAERRVSQRLPSSPARTRFAPSPTGYLHLGSLRTALFNYLLARATGGQFLLRIEDTDKNRTVPDADERLYRDLRWAGLQWDEGPGIGGPHGPYKQSERTALYREHAEKLLQSGHAYRCFCSSEKLTELARRRAKLGLPSDYDRTCDGIPREQSDERASTGDPFVVRLRVPSEPPEYTDLVYGSVGKPNHNKKAHNLGEALYEDPVILKSDGLPTYHLANVVDDHYMDITHVVRAAEWMSSTPKHLVLYNAFGWKAPDFAHVGLLQNSSRQKFSKRKGDLDIQKFAEDGILPEALLNYVALYGWSHTHKSDVLTLSDLIASFDLKFTKGNTIVQPHKLMYLQKKYAAKYAEEDGPQFEALVNGVFEAVEQELKTPSWFPESVYLNPLQGSALKSRIAVVMKYTAKSYTTPLEFFGKYGYFFYEVPLPSPGSIDFEGRRDEIYRSARDIHGLFSVMAPHRWTEGSLKRTMSELVDDIDEDMGSLKRTKSEVVDGIDEDMHSDDAATDANRQLTHKAVQLFLRWAIASGEPGPSMNVTMALLGKDVCLERLENAARLLDKEEVSMKGPLQGGKAIEHDTRA